MNLLIIIKILHLYYKNKLFFFLQKYHEKAVKNVINLEIYPKQLFFLYKQLIKKNKNLINTIKNQAITSSVIFYNTDKQ